MNLKVLEDIYKTFTDMRSSIYVLGYLAGLQAVSFAIYLAYKYIKDESEAKKKLEEKDDTQNEDEQEDKQEKENELTDELQMEPIDQIEQDKHDDKLESEHDKQELYSLLTSKKDDLENLINQLTMIQDNIMTIRDKLEELNKKTN